MSLFRVNIFGRDLRDRLVVQLIIGGICILILFFLLGGEQIGDWIINSLTIWVGAMFFFIPIAFWFVYEYFHPKYVIIMILGIAILIAYSFYGTLSTVELISSVLKSLVWMSLFSLILDQVKNKIDF